MHTADKSRRATGGAWTRALLAAGAVTLLASCATSTPTTAGPTGPAGTAGGGTTAAPGGTAPPGPKVVMVAGDIVCDPALDHPPELCQDAATAALIGAASPDSVITTGDNQYEDGAIAKYRDAYDKTWGRFKAITHPVAGNHEYNTPGGAGFHEYFGAAAGEPGKSYYSTRIGAWQVIVLNSNCAAVGGCQAGSPQETWLRAELAKGPGAACTLAVWHHPRFSTGVLHNDNAGMQPFWEALYAAGADLVLAGHEHNYERFAPQDPSGAADPAKGIVEIVVGSGGKNHYPFKDDPRPNSVVRNAEAFGVLKLTLRADGYDYEFVPVAGQTFTDKGTGTCH